MIKAALLEIKETGSEWRNKSADLGKKECQLYRPQCQLYSADFLMTYSFLRSNLFCRNNL